jgi:5-methylcytosine-specific restriction endonuclease McrA
MASRTHISPSRRTLVYHKFNGHCAYCGQELTMWDMEVDHIKPYYMYHDNSIENLFPSCAVCNAVKSTYALEKFREVLQDKIKSNKGKISSKEFYQQQEQPVKFYYELQKDKSDDYGQK